MKGCLRNKLAKLTISKLNKYISELTHEDYKGSKRCEDTQTTESYRQDAAAAAARSDSRS